MDPLSLTSGIVGIVAFALQLAKTASKVKKAVEEVKSAPKEARELIESLMMLEATCQLIGSHLERRENLPGHSSSASPDIISKALAQCLVKIQDLERMLFSSGPGDSESGTPRLKFDTASRVRLVLRKEKISSLIQEIDRVVSLLQFVIQVDMWAMTTTPLQLLPPSNEDSPLMDLSSKPESFSAPSRPTVSLSRRRATNKQCHTSRYLGCITWTVADGKTGDDHEADTIAYKKTSIAFRLPFTSTRLGMDYVGGMGTPSYALNITHVIEHESELGQRLLHVVSHGNDPKKLHELVSGRELSIYSVFRGGSKEINIFFLAVGVRWAEGCKYLLEHDFRHQFRQEETPEYMGSTVLRTFGSTCEITDTILSSRAHEMQGKDIKYLLETGRHPEYFNRYLEVFLKCPDIDHADLVSFAWDCIVKNIFPTSFYELSSWIPSLRYLIEQGVDIHQRWNVCFSSTYMMILGTTDHPLEAEENIYSWLEMLDTCGVELASYLQVEITRFKENEISRYDRKRKLVILDFHGLPMPSWQWEEITESSIVEVLEEFHILGNGRMAYELDGPSPSGPDDFKCWKSGDNCSAWVEFCFPFSLSPLDCIQGMYDYRLKKIWCRETFNRAVEIRDKRLARRQVKKWRKAHPGEKPPSKKMPGTWVD